MEVRILSSALKLSQEAKIIWLAGPTMLTVRRWLNAGGRWLAGMLVGRNHTVTGVCHNNAPSAISFGPYVKKWKFAARGARNQT